MRQRSTGFALSAMLAPAASLHAQPAVDLGRYFGFQEPRIVVIDEGAGPLVSADFNADGLTDFAVVNNRKSRIEIHLQRAEPLTDGELTRQLRVNDLAPSRWYDRRVVGVSHRVASLVAHDLNQDGRPDLAYAGQPPEIVLLAQKQDGDFEELTRRRVPALAASRDAIRIADVTGGPDPELLAVARGRINVFPLSSTGALGQQTELGSSRSQDDAIVAIFVEDFDGNGLADVLGAVPDSAAPLRVWLQRPASESRDAFGPKDGLLGSELRFEMPALREAEPVRTPGAQGAAIAVIERASRRMVLYDLTQEQIERPEVAGERDVQAEVRGFPSGGEARDRAVAVADIDRDGRLDLLAADPKANSLLLYRQREGLGLASFDRFSAFKAPSSLATGQWDGEGPLEVFVLSNDEKAVGVSRYDARSGVLSFPEPIGLATPGASPVAMACVEMSDGPALAVVVQERRDHTLELHRPNGDDAMTLTLEGVNRPPRSMLAADVDRDGSRDLLLFTPGEPMVMVRALESGEPRVLTDRTMRQFGLVQAAGPDNTALLDVDDDGHEELLIAHENFVRACAFDPEKGWRVVEQITSPDSDTRFAGLTIVDDDDRPAIVASDSAGGRLVIMRRAEGRWEIADRLRIGGFEPRAIHAGAFSGDGRESILSVGDEGFAIVRLSGRRYTLEELASWRSDEENRLEHEISAGDVNGDGYTDLIVLDAQERMCQIFTLSAARQLHFATEFKVFESRLYDFGAERRDFQPSFALLDDLTGDGATDLALLVHDRVIVYPQMTSPE